MAEHHLPDDPQHWPENPFEVLGVEPTSSEQDIKRAYTRLIRRFKPEHHPEQFRRVREAFEAVNNRIKWLGYFHLPELSSPAPAEDESVPVAKDREPSPLAESREPERPRPVIVDPVEDAWKLAVANQRSEAYSRLLDLEHSLPGRADIAMRLYWLLAIQPELDTNRSRHHWLFAALTRSRLAGPAAELYRRELDAFPRMALSEPYSRLLEVDAAGGNLLRVAHQRLKTAGFNRFWAAMNRDLETLATRTATLEEVGWLGYLVAVAAHAGYERPDPLYESCRNLVATLRHLELRESWAFDQIEEHQHLADVWRAAADAPQPLLEVVRDAWLSPAEGWKNSLWRVVAWAADDPVNALIQFDMVARVPERQAVLAAFQRIIDEHAQRPENAYPPELIRGLIREFVTTNGRGHYDGMRRELLRLLVREAIDPEEMVQACLLDSSLGPRALVEHVRTDPMLRLVWRTASACR